MSISGSSFFLSVVVVVHSGKDGIFMHSRMVLVMRIGDLSVLNIKVRDLSWGTNPN